MALIMVGPPSKLGAAQPTADVEEWVTLRSPDDDIHAAILAALQKAAATQPTPQVSMSIYGFTLPDFGQQLEVLAKNPKSVFVFDHTQAVGKAEKLLLAQFASIVPASQRVVGTSPSHGQILHSKVISILYADGSGWTVTGSFNFSSSAQEQFNLVDLILSRSRAELFTTWINEIFDWVQANEPQIL